MKKELEYFTIDDEFGGNQDWFTNIVMNIGGCGAATACDSCIYFAKYMGIVLLSTVPTILINAYNTKEQKKASRVADMLAINEMQDYRTFK